MILTTCYTDNAEFGGTAWRISQILKLILERGPDRGHFPEQAKSKFIADSTNQETEKQEIETEGLQLKFDGGSQYLEEYLGPREEVEAWVQPQVEAWANRVQILCKIAKRHP